MTLEPIMRLSDICKSYQAGSGHLEVLRGLDLDLVPAQITGLVGPSGSGKSTLLHIAGLLDSPDSGTIFLDGRDVASMSERDRTLARRRRLGFVYQFHHLLPELNAWENVAAPLMIDGTRRSEARERAYILLGEMGMEERGMHRPSQLSGGEQQRVAIARALVNKPALVIADEPTGNLDPENSQSVFGLFFEIARKEGASVLAATHNLGLTSSLDRVYSLRGGVLVSSGSS